MRRAAYLITSVLAMAAVPAAATASEKPELPPICGPTMLCQVEPLPELPPILP